MVSARPSNTNGSPPDPAGETGGGQDCRLNLLLTYGGWRSDSWADCLPRLLAPMGVRTWRADSGREAAELLRRQGDIHLAIVDLRLPLERRRGTCPMGGEDPATEEGGARLLQLLQRSNHPPPTIVVKPARTARDDARNLTEALRHGVFAVMDRPVDLELMLEVFRRVLRRHYKNRWPGAGEPRSA